MYPNYDLLCSICKRYAIMKKKMTPEIKGKICILGKIIYYDRH